MLCPAPEARRLRTVRSRWSHAWRHDGAIYLIVCVASAAAAVVGIATLFADAAPVPHAAERVWASTANAREVNR